MHDKRNVPFGQQQSYWIARAVTDIEVQIATVGKFASALCLRSLSIAWPVKQRHLVKWVVDSRKWNDFQMRDDDIVISTWSKSGTN